MNLILLFAGGNYSELQREKAWSRIHLLPLLLAEGDRDVYRREQAALAREKEIMKDVPDWEVSFFFVPELHESTGWPWVSASNSRSLTLDSVSGSSLAP